MIQLSELTKSFGDRVLFDHVTWQITDRERVGLCGPNGAGKTTLLTVLQGLGFKASDVERPAETFSGGWQMRIALAKLLLGQPNLLLLDEPTNHLDLDARNWLEEYLNAYPHAVILVSHDRFFLDAVVTRIADLTLRTLTDYHTNYSGYLAEHHERIEAMRKAKREQDEEVARVR